MVWHLIVFADLGRTSPVKVMTFNTVNKVALKRTTKKEFRNQKKKAVKKGAQGPPFQVKRGPVFVTFD